jgi:valyl-tRNA synthetase
MKDMKMVFMKWMTFTRSWLIWGLLWFGLKEPVFGQQKNQNPVTEYEEVLSTLLDKASDAEDLKRIKPEIEKILQNWMSTTFVQEIRRRDPSGSSLFLKMCLEMEVDRKILEKWVLMMPESVGVEYELLQMEAVSFHL